MQEHSTPPLGEEQLVLTSVHDTAAMPRGGATAPPPHVYYYTGPAVPDLPDDLLVSILARLSIAEMLSVTMVSRGWHTVTARDSVWRAICIAKVSTVCLHIIRNLENMHD